MPGSRAYRFRALPVITGSPEGPSGRHWPLRNHLSEEFLPRRPTSWASSKMSSMQWCLLTWTLRGINAIPLNGFFDRLVDEHRAVISYSTVRQYVKARRTVIAVEAGNAPVEVFVPQEHAPGREGRGGFR